MKHLFVLLLLATASSLFAQKLSITGQVADATGAALPGASVVLQRPSGDVVKTTVAGADGSFEIKELRGGPYLLKITMMGFEELQRQFSLSGQSLALGVLRLSDNSKLLGEVQVKEQMVTATQKEDTVQFNAGAFKVMKDANADELIEKMPGVSVENGRMKAQGENIQQVLVDGKPFFGNDPTAALKALPAEIIEKVQIFDAQSEQAQFTGFSDGTTTKTINIVTKSQSQQGQFGKMYAGYGYDEKYQAGGNLNFFDGDRRVSVIGMSNNINVQNFSTDDILGVVGGNSGGNRGGGQRGGGSPGGPGGGGQRWGGGGTGDFLVNASGGVATTHAFGLNYSERWGKKAELTGSYFFNRSIANADKLTNRQFVADETANERYDETSNSHTENTNHRLNLRFEWQMDSMNSINIRPRLTAQQNNGNSATLGATTLGLQTLNATDSRYLSNLDGLNFSNSLLYRHKFPKKGRTVSLDISNGYSPKRGESELNSVNFYAQPIITTDSLDQRGTLDVHSWNVAGNLEYTEPLGKNGQLLLNYRHSYQQESSDRYIYDWAEATNGYDLLNEPLSNVFSNDYVTRQTGAGYNFSRNPVLNISARIGAQWAELANEQVFPRAATADRTFFNLLPSGFVRVNFDKNRNLRLSYRTNTQLPAVEQLQNVVNNTNPLQLTAGNPDLLQAEQHNLFFRYQASNPAKSTSLFFMVGGGFTRDYIGSSTFFASSDDPIFADLDVQPGAQLTLPTNLDGYRNARSFFTYGLPIKKIKCNLNLDLSYNYSRTPGLVNRELNLASTNAFGTGLTLSSNISDKVDFSISARPTWNITRNTLRTSANTEYLTQNSRVKFNWQIIEGFVIRTDLTHTLYSGLSDGFNQNFWLWNLGIGKKILKNQRGEITLAVNDLLSQNRSIQRTVTESYIEDVRTNALTRFVMLSFTYNLRHFNTGKKATAPEKTEEERRRW